MQDFADFYNVSDCDTSPYLNTFCDIYQRMISEISRNARNRAMFIALRENHLHETAALFNDTAEVLDVITEAMDASMRAVSDVLGQFGVDVRTIAKIETTNRPLDYSEPGDFITGIYNGKINCVYRRNAIVNGCIDIKYYHSDSHMENLFGRACCDVIDLANNLIGLFGHMSATILHYISNLPPQMASLYSGNRFFPYVNVRVCSQRNMDIPQPERADTEPPDSDIDTDTDVLSLASQCANEDHPNDLIFMEI